ncbi:hypothetical protein GXW74_12525 [Roseomonas eburnea]|uniref:Uncharacterized protein n=1 Tax=Neoroseomonas eburnea TaxID=1346889 RepID=A0A9X9XC76_9PROT|nr:hypothetical protein [Neoroseomonas eburnea]MBR0681312.1 hypothetical protein [Neoroseomonas eburnea]
MSAETEFRPNFRSEFLSLIRQDGGPLDLERPDAAEGLARLRDCGTLAARHQLVPAGQEYILGKFKADLRALLVAPQATAERVASRIDERLSAYRYRPSALTFANSLPLLASVYASLAPAANWRVFPSIIRPEILDSAWASVAAYEAAGCAEDLYSQMARAVLHASAGDMGAMIARCRCGASLFNQDPLLAPKPHLHSDLRGAFTVMTPREVVAALSRKAVPPQIQLAAVASTQCRYIVFSCADIRYFDRFHERAIQSFLHNTQEAGYHLHLLSPSAEAAEIARSRLERYTAGGRVGFSHSPDENPGDVAYYTLGRYFVVSQIQSLYERPIFVSDIDQTTRSDCMGLVSKLQGRDLTLALYIKKRPLVAAIPWFLFGAGLLLINNNPHGRLYGEVLNQAALDAFVRAGAVRYNIDQNIIWSTVDYMRQRISSFTLSDLAELGPYPMVTITR